MHLEPKKIHGRQLTAPELATYIRSYVALFQVGTYLLLVNYVHALQKGPTFMYRWTQFVLYSTL